MDVVTLTDEQCFTLTGLPPTSLSAFPQVYVLKRPYVDEFLRRMGELFECVLFTASLAKVPEGGREVRRQERLWQPQGGGVPQPLAGPREATVVGAGGARTASEQKHLLF